MTRAKGGLVLRGGDGNEGIGDLEIVTLAELPQVLAC